jgi:hypothetical protein
MEAKDRRAELESRFKTLYQMAESTVGFNSVVNPDNLDKVTDADLKSEIQWFLTLLRTPH